jgi:Arc/MetJ-type ribon-helix-helix transcriptional regulator
MSTRKVSLTLPEELLARAEKAVAAGDARSVSAYIAAAAGSGETRTTVTEVIARWRTEHGEPGAAERAEAQARARALFDRADTRLRGDGAA